MQRILLLLLIVFTVVALPSRGQPIICGNQILETDEQCDDGNIVNGDGCSETCTLEDTIAPTCAGNLLINGSFEENFENGIGESSLDKDSLSITGWKVINGQIDYLDSYWVASHGTRSLDLDGTPGVGGIEQTFETMAGTIYTVSFDLAGNIDFPGEKFLKVSIGDTSREYVFDSTGHSSSNLGWENKSFTFTAISSSSTIKFESQSTDPSSSYGPAIDNVCITEGVTSSGGTNSTTTSSNNSSTETSSSTTTCGNGILESEELCDDGNTTNGDGCSSACQIEVITNCTVTSTPGCEFFPNTGSASSIQGFDNLGNSPASYWETTTQSCWINAQQSTNDSYTHETKFTVPSNIDLTNYIIYLKIPSDDQFTASLNGQPVINTTATEGQNNLIFGGGEWGTQGPTVTLNKAGGLITGLNTFSIKVDNTGGGPTGHSITATYCGVGPTCGNGSVEISEQCDDGNTTNGDDCDSTCQTEIPPPPNPVCGNGSVETSEQCDDGNTTNGDDCDSTCQTEIPPPPNPVCGNGSVEISEQCDDGNTTNGDGCNETCANEQTDSTGTTSNTTTDSSTTDSSTTDSSTTDSSTTDSSTTDSSTTDSSTTDSSTTSTTTDGTSTDSSSTTSTTNSSTTCGNGILEADHEECDDGNTVSGDGCSDSCTDEATTSTTTTLQNCGCLLSEDGFSSEENGCKYNDKVWSIALGSKLSTSDTESSLFTYFDGAASVTWELAKQFCDEFEQATTEAGKSCGGGWRLPTLDELAQIAPPDPNTPSDFARKHLSLSSINNYWASEKGQAHSLDFGGELSLVSGSIAVICIKDSIGTTSTTNTSSDDEFDNSLGSEGIAEESALPPDGEDFCTSDDELDDSLGSEGIAEESALPPDGEDFCTSDDELDDSLGTEGITEESALPPDGEDFCTSTTDSTTTDSTTTNSTSTDSSSTDSTSSTDSSTTDSDSSTTSSTTTDSATTDSTSSNDSSSTTTTTDSSTTDSSTTDSSTTDSTTTNSTSTDSSSTDSTSSTGSSTTDSDSSTTSSSTTTDSATTDSTSSNDSSTTDSSTTGSSILSVTNTTTTTSICGNYISESNEQCDDGNTLNNDGCSSVCQTETPITPVCGNGILQNGEICDDGNTTNGDGCSSACQIEIPTTPVCGNGIVESGEICDDGNTTNGDGCSSVCQIEVITNCTVTSTPGCEFFPNTGSASTIQGFDNLGNSPASYWETTTQSCWINAQQSTNDSYTHETKFTVPSNIDLTNYIIYLKIPSDDQFTASLNGQPINNGQIFGGGEWGSQGPTVTLNKAAGLVIGLNTFSIKVDNTGGGPTGHSITATYCGVGPICGNGTVDTGEECEDGNTNNDDGCSNSCKLEACNCASSGDNSSDNGSTSSTCGNGTVDSGEECEDGNTNSDDGCSNSCKLEACNCNSSGDDSSDSNSTSSSCGNGTVDSSEECEDGNTNSNDGCSNSCKLEACNCT